MVNEKRREVQLMAVDALEQHKYNGVVIAPTGIGKAWILIECLKRLKPKGRVWYLCDSTENRDVTFKKELKKWDAEEWIDKIEFMCYQSAYKFDNERGDLMLCDEFDMALTPMYSQGITENKFKHKVMVSASLNPEKRAMAKTIAPIVFEKYIKEVEDEGLLNKAEHYFVNFMLSKEENSKYLGYNETFRRLLNDDRPHKARLEMLQIQRKHFLSSLGSSKNVCKKLIRKLYSDKSNKVLVFCGLSDQADEICDYSYHSKSEYDYLKPFDEGKIRVLTVVAKADRGLNLNGVNNIIFESPTKSSTKMIQRSGRGRRLQVDDMLYIFYLIPYYTTKHGAVEPTIVKKWVFEATTKMNFEPKDYKL